jgi:hypothetical protein
MMNIIHTKYFIPAVSAITVLVTTVVVVPQFIGTPAQPRQNPLIAANPQDTVLWFKQIATPQMDTCTPFLANPQNAPIPVECANEKNRVLQALNQGGFINEPILAEDLESTTPWLRYFADLKPRLEVKKMLGNSPSQRQPSRETMKEFYDRKAKEFGTEN